MAKFTLTMPEGTLSGNFKLTVAGGTTDDITAPGTANDIQTALRNVSGETDATATGNDGGPYTITVASDTLEIDAAGITGANRGSTAKVEKDTTPPGPGGGVTPGPGGATPNPDGVTFEDLREAQGKLIRKALGGLILVAPMTVPYPTEFFVDGGEKLVDFKSLGFKKLGWLTKGDGITFARETESAETESFGAQEPTRIDYTKDTNTVTFKPQETNKQVLELYHNKELSDVKVSSKGEISFEEDAVPESRYYRFIYIAKDGNKDNAFYIIKGMPKALVSEVQEQQWSQETEIQYGMTVKGTKDDDLGFALQHRFGGPGFVKLAKDMGFEM